MPEFHAFAISKNFQAGNAVAAFMGGALLGFSVLFMTGLTGEVLGVSGCSRSLLVKPAPDKVAFLVGLIVMGAIMSRTYEGSFEPLPPHIDLSGHNHTLYMARLLVGGMLVGIGTAFGNGCTSGHGLTGLARLSLRSWVGVPCFMCFGAISATFLHGVAYVPPNLHCEHEAANVQRAALWSAVVVVGLALSALALVAAQRALGEEAKKRLDVVVCFISGVSFCCGLGVSGMSRASKVVGFMDLGSGAWDPALAFVMGGALCFTMPFFQIIERKDSAKPLLGGRFGLVSKADPVNRELVIGTAIFGSGWGLCGMCPGPIWANVGAFNGKEVLLVVGGLFLGNAVWVVWQKYMTNSKDEASGKTGAYAQVDNNTNADPKKPLV